MKRLLFLLALLFTITLVNAQEEKVEDKVVDNTTITEAERIIDKYTGKVYEFAENTAKALEQPAKEVFKTVVRLQVAKGIGLMLLPILSIVTLILSFYYNNTSHKKGIKQYGKDNQWRPDDNWQGAMYVVTLIIGLVFLVGSIFSTYWGLQYLMAPEWYGIKEILTLF